MLVGICSQGTNVVFYPLELFFHNVLVKVFATEWVICIVTWHRRDINDLQFALLDACNGDFGRPTALLFAFNLARQLISDFVSARLRWDSEALILFCLIQVTLCRYLFSISIDHERPGSRLLLFHVEEGLLGPLAECL